MIVYLLSLPDAETAITRVAEWVRQGGQDISEPVIRQRSAAGLQSFEQYQLAVDQWMKFVNAGEIPILLDEGTNPLERKNK